MRLPDSQFNFFIHFRCPTDYLQITDNTGTYKVCGWKKIGFDNELCSSTVYLNYKTPAMLSTTLYKGLKLYYECKWQIWFLEI